MKTAGYSGTPLYKKLGIRSSQRACFLGAPEQYEDELRRVGDLDVADKLEKDLDFLHFFTDSHKSLKQQFPRLRDSIKRSGMLWISWPKKSSGKTTDLDENIVREIGLKSGLVDVKVCAVDETWSALKFVFRLKDR